MLRDAVLRLAQASAGGDAELAAIERAHLGRSIVTKNDQLVYGESDPMTEVYLLVAGTVRLFVGEGESTRTTLLLAAPAIFGDRDILAGCPVSQESATSVSKAGLLAFDRAELEDSFARDEPFRAFLTRDLFLRYARATRYAHYLAAPLQRRVLWLLHDRFSGEGELPSYESLAAMSDSAPKSIGRAVKTLQEQGLLELGASRHFLLSPVAREELAANELLGLVHRLQ